MSSCEEAAGLHRRGSTKLPSGCQGNMYLKVVVYTNVLTLTHMCDADYFSSIVYYNQSVCGCVSGPRTHLACVQKINYASRNTQF